MTDTNNEWIRKAHLQFRDNGKGNQTGDDFRKAIEDNLPKQISREAVEKLRNRWESEKSNRAYNESDYDRMGEFIQDLDQILSPTNSQDDTN